MTHAQIIKRSGYAAVAAATGAKLRTVKAWRARNSIPGWFWPALARAGMATLEELAAGVSAKRAA
jgi:hypothetical protein